MITISGHTTIKAGKRAAFRGFAEGDDSGRAASGRHYVIDPCEYASVMRNGAADHGSFYRAARARTSSNRPHLEQLFENQPKEIRMPDTPNLTAQHQALSVFLGRWSARGTSYGYTDQSGADSKANGETWVSTHEGRWHTGGFFLVQDERADIAGSRFDTLSVMGVDEDGAYFSRGFENHGFYRNYKVSRDGDIWTFTGATERAKVAFEDNGKRQVWTWEWKPADAWLPLCDRTAERID